MARNRFFISALAFITATAADAAGEVDLSRFQTGTLSPAIVESSGLACAGPDELWTHNDAGNAAELFRIGADGAVLDAFTVEGIENRDWEDLAIFWSAGRAHLVIADIGDNNAQRPEIWLRLLQTRVEAGDARPAIEKSIRIQYPGGARDSESLAIDSRSKTAWLLSKRTVPAEIYTVPLDGAESSVVTATLEGTLTSLPQPTDEDIALAPERMDWFWQPTAMDFSPDGSLAAVLTYEGIYLYTRSAEESWIDAFAKKPQRFAIGSGRAAEALCLSGDAVFWTTEGESAPLFRIPLNDPSWETPTRTLP